VLGLETGTSSAKLSHTDLPEYPCDPKGEMMETYGQITCSVRTPARSGIMKRQKTKDKRQKTKDPLQPSSRFTAEASFASGTQAAPKGMPRIREA